MRDGVIDNLPIGVLGAFVLKPVIMGNVIEGVQRQTALKAQHGHILDASLEQDLTGQTQQWDMFGEQFNRLVGDGNRIVIEVDSRFGLAAFSDFPAI